MRNPRLLLVPLAIAALAMPSLPVGADSHDVRALPFSFTPTHLTQAKVAGGSNFAEPSIELSAADHAFFCGPIGIPGGNIGFVRTADWQTYKRLTINDKGGGGDCDIEVGPDGAVYTANLQAWASAIRKSVDDGQSFAYQSSEDAVEQDRQWLAVDPVDGSIVYLAYHDWTIGAIVIGKSIDGAKTFAIHSLVSSDVTIHGQGVRGSIPGTLRVDPTNHNRLYMTWSIPQATDTASDTVACPNHIPAAPGQCIGTAHRTIVVGRSDDGGLTWVNRIAMSAPPGSRLGTLIPWLAVDNAGNVIITAAGWIAQPDGSIQHGLFMTTSSDANSWSAPVKVNQGTDAVVFPTVIAGSSGIADFAWLERTVPATVPPAPAPPAEWRLHFAQTRNVLSDTPAFTEVEGPLVHYGDVCTEGLGCLVSGGDRTLLDFIDMELDSFGYAHIAGFSSLGLDHVVWWRQDAGPSAYSEPCEVAGDADCVTVRPGPRP